MGERKFCKSAFNNISISWNGDLGPCVLDWDQKINFGNVSKSSINSILNSIRYKNFLKSHYKKDFSKLPLCDSCAGEPGNIPSSSIKFLGVKPESPPFFNDKINPCFIIEPSNSCCCSCIHCERSKDPNKYPGVLKGEERFMEFNLWKKIIDEISESYDSADFMLHWRAESFTNPDFPKMLIYLLEKKNINKVIKLDTTLNCVNEIDLIKLLKSIKKNEDLIEIFELSFSLDAINSQTYEKIRRGGNFIEVKRKIHEVINLRNKLKLFKLALRFQFIIEPINFHHALDFKNYWEKYINKSIDQIYLKKCHGKWDFLERFPNIYNKTLKDFNLFSLAKIDKSIDLDIIPNRYYFADDNQKFLYSDEKEKEDSISSEFGFGISSKKIKLLQHIFGLTFTSEMTDICNLNCVYCSHTFCPDKPHEKNPVGLIDPELFKKVIDNITNPSGLFYFNHEVIIHWLGESLFHPEFESMVKYAGSAFKKTGHKLYLDTNANFLSEKITEVILNNPFERVHFSLDAATKGTYDEIRRGGDFNKVMKNVKYFLKTRRELGLIKPKVMLQFIPIPLIKEKNIIYSRISNDLEIKQFVDFWDDFLKETNTLDETYQDAIFIKPLNTLADRQQDCDDFYKEAVRKSGIKAETKKHVRIITPLDNNWGKSDEEMNRDIYG
jgi:radical SAM protein with 4Fe4S-binding SPASM domain